MNNPFLVHSDRFSYPLNFSEHVRRHDEALIETAHLIQANPASASNRPVSLTRARGLAGTGRLAEPIALLKTTLGTAPGYAEAHKTLGQVYLKTGRPRIALEHLRRASKLQLTDPDIIAAIRKAEMELSRAGPAIP